MKGFYLHYNDILEPAAVKSLNVVRVPIDRNKRYSDISLKNQFWKDLEAFLKKEKFKDAKF